MGFSIRILFELWAVLMDLLCDLFESVGVGAVSTDGDNTWNKWILLRKEN